MIKIDVKNILTFIMENTVQEIDMSRYWYKFDTEVGLLEKDLYALYEKDYIENLKNLKLIRQAKPYLLTYTPLIIFPLYHLLYNNLLDDPNMLLSNKLLTNSSTIIGYHIVNSNDNNIVTDILNMMYIKFNNDNSFAMYMFLIKKLELKIINQYWDILENRIFNISINRIGVMSITPDKNIYEYRYKELEDSLEVRYGDDYGE